ncbi:MAG: hypothetical protein ACLFV7_01575 [Phycisphaerae bacterium]
MPKAPSPNIALLVEQEDCDKAELLRDALGLPQLQVVANPDVAALHTFVAMGAELSVKEGGNGWRLARGRRLRGELELELPGQPQCRANLPAERTFVTAPVRRDDRSDLENAAELTLYYCLKRAEKLPPGTESHDRTDLRIFGAVLGRRGPRRWRKRLLPIVRNCLDEPPSPPSPQPLTTVYDWHEVLWGLVDNLEDRTRRCLVLEVKRSPASLVAYVLSEPDRTRRHIIPDERFTEQMDQWTKARTLAAVGLAGLLLWKRKIVIAAMDRLLGPEIFCKETGCLRAAPSAGGYAFSGMVAALLMLEARRADRRFRPVPYDRQRRKMRWEGFAGEDLSMRVAGPRRVHGLLDLQRRRISRSLLENWLTLQAVPSLDERQYEISDQDYSQATANVEAAWREAFRRVAEEADLPLVRLLPWPAGHRWALSLRYDVDRPVRPEQVMRIREIQQDLLGAWCGSWYFLPDGPGPDGIDPPLEQWGQEIGVHSLRAADAREGQGVTCHSAQISEYWRGVRSIRAAEDAHATYAEHLAGNLPLPRPAWLADEDRPSRIPLTPIHFPLEGSTQDTTLDYFDRRVEAFRRQRARGGHVIIGTHPDLNQELLAELIGREGLDGAWAVPVGAAVARCRRIFAPGAVEVLKASAGELTLRAREHISALAGQVWLPGQSEPLTFGVDLPSDAAVRVPLTPDAGTPG